MLYSVRLTCPKYELIEAPNKKRAMLIYLEQVEITPDDLWAEEVTSEHEKDRKAGRL